MKDILLRILVFFRIIHAKEYELIVYNRQNAHFSIWTVEDVIGCAEDDDIIITNKQAIQVLRELDTNAPDANIGVNWDTIRDCIYDIVDTK